MLDFSSVLLADALLEAGIDVPVRGEMGALPAGGAGCLILDELFAARFFELDLGDEAILFSTAAWLNLACEAGRDANFTLDPVVA